MYLGPCSEIRALWNSIDDGVGDFVAMYIRSTIELGSWQTQPSLLFRSVLLSIISWEDGDGPSMSY